MFGADLKTWFRADNLSFDVNGMVLAWRDWSGRGKDVFGDVVDERPQQVTMASGQRAVFFGEGHALVARNAHDWGLLHNGGYTLILVADFSALADEVVVGSTPGLDVSLGSRAVVLDYDTGTVVTTVEADTDAGLRTVVVRAGGTNPLSVELRVNGVDEASGDVTMTAPARPPRRPLGFTGDGLTVAEFVIIGRRITDDELASHEAYYSRRYG